MLASNNIDKLDIALAIQSGNILNNSQMPHRRFDIAVGAHRWTKSICLGLIVNGSMCLCMFAFLAIFILVKGADTWFQFVMCFGMVFGGGCFMFNMMSAAIRRLKEIGQNSDRGDG
ncbi:hypothetical protein [Planctomicrobium piriforme]|uniref:hypothetical protein n=1 Tax=Planctomicrobium piriforme TaxID=1576369 RepID=UPI000B830F13|nr:hypothetical protein [Planctomicrobium piriforme]